MTPQARTKPRRPFGVTLLSILQFLIGLQFLISAIWAWGVSSWADSPEGIDSLTDANVSAKAVSGVFFLAGIICIAISISAFLLSRGYFKGFEKSRRRGRTVAVLGIAFVVLMLILPIPAKLDPDSPLFTIILNLVVFVYLGSLKVKTYFG